MLVNDRAAPVAQGAGEDAVGQEIADARVLLDLLPGAGIAAGLDVVAHVRVHDHQVQLAPVQLDRIELRDRFLGLGDGAVDEGRCEQIAREDIAHRSVGPDGENHRGRAGIQVGEDVVVQELRQPRGQLRLRERALVVGGPLLGHLAREPHRVALLEQRERIGIDGQRLLVALHDGVVLHAGRGQLAAEGEGDLLAGPLLELLFSLDEAVGIAVLDELREVDLPAGLNPDPGRPAGDGLDLA